MPVVRTEPEPSLNNSYNGKDKCIINWSSCRQARIREKPSKIDFLITID